MRLKTAERLFQHKNPKKKKLTMATNAEFPPYEYYDKGKIVGVDADMMQAAFIEYQNHQRKEDKND